MNEPNQPAFLRPQFGPAGTNVSAATGGRVPRGGVRRAQGRRPGDPVIGLGLSPRGNDRPTRAEQRLDLAGAVPRRARRLVSASGRTRPMMDGLSFHPYPNQATDSLERGYRWPNAGFANLDRIKQAIWDAFRGTAQPTTANGLKLYLDEVGWQVDTSRPRRLHRRRERQGHRSRRRRRGCTRDLVHLADVRPDDRRGEHLRVLRRRAARQRLPGGAERGRRHAAALRGRGAGGDRAVGARAARARVAWHPATARGRRDRAGLADPADRVGRPLRRGGRRGRAGRRVPARRVGSAASPLRARWLRARRASPGCTGGEALPARPVRIRLAPSVSRSGP